MTDRPAKVADLELSQVDDGYLVYHSARERVHYLNHTAALVLEFCTGENGVEEIVAIMARAYDLSEPPTEEIAGCVEHLRTEGLVA